MSSPVKKLNGKQTQSVVCRHSPGCQVAQGLEDIKAVLGESLQQMAESMDDLRRRQGVTDQREEQWLGVMGAIESRLARIEERLPAAGGSK